MEEQGVGQRSLLSKTTRKKRKLKQLWNWKKQEENKRINQNYVEGK